MNSFMYSVIRNAQIVGVTDKLICFVKNNRLGYVNPAKVVGVLVKKEGSDFQNIQDVIPGRCTVYANKGTYFGGMTYAFSEITQVLEKEIVVKTGKFTAKVPLEDVSVILMRDKM